MKFTKQNLIDLCPCVEGLAFARLHQFVWEDVWLKSERGDWLIWWLSKSGQLDKAKAVQIAVACADRVLPQFEALHPGDLRPRKAIEAAKAWLEQHPSAAAAAAAAAAAERKWQAEKIREIVGRCPFEDQA